uniref:AMSH-like ubiquitin thioesterase 2 isoform X5 n=1 Tax=Fragaria vesca subsp. vesca TaxID=101020 RepID=UPI0005CA9D7E|nr:PREDICTED: AMSH-like ubiquitin thioesterase 2 isoform X5 [Fragaria vesca subsp. vesca]
MAERNLLSLRIINGEQATLSSLDSVESGSSCLACKFFAPSELQNITVHAVTQCTPSPLISCTASMPQGATVSQITAANSEQLCDQSSSSSRVLRDVHISARLMEDFLQLAKENTDKDLETCGTLGAFLKNETFYVTTLIIPKQESTSSSCQAINDEEVFAIQNEQSLFPAGWIHTHPSQSCFMSSVDLHTHYSFQVNDSVVHGSILLEKVIVHFVLQSLRLWYLRLLPLSWPQLILQAMEYSGYLSLVG